MKKHSYITKSFGLALVVMTLLIGIFSRQLSYQYEKGKISAKQEKSENKENSESKTTVSELSLEVVMPSHAFDFGLEAIILPTPQFIYITLESFSNNYPNYFFRLAYFESLCEHFIAPNAP